MSDGDAFRPDLKGLARRSFSKQVQAERFSDPAKLDRAIQANRIEQKSARIAEKAKTHFETHRSQWVAKEYARQKTVDAAVMKHSLSEGPKPPAGADRTELRNQALLARAEALVDLRHQRRMHSLERTSRRLVRDVLQGREHSQSRRR